jgi:hypothetical protein
VKAWLPPKSRTETIAHRHKLRENNRIDWRPDDRHTHDLTALPRVGTLQNLPKLPPTMPQNKLTRKCKQPYEETCTSTRVKPQGPPMRKDELTMSCIRHLVECISCPTRPHATVDSRNENWTRVCCRAWRRCRSQDFARRSGGRRNIQRQT